MRCPRNTVLVLVLVLVALSGCARPAPFAPFVTVPPGGFEIYLQRTSGGPPFNENRLFVSSTGVVVSVEQCDTRFTSEPICDLRIPNAVAGGPTAMACDSPKQPVLRARAPAAELAVLRRIVTSEAFAKLGPRYYQPMHDVGAFTLVVRTERGDKSIFYSPWTEFEKEPVSKVLNDALSSLLGSLDLADGSCAAKGEVPRIEPPHGF